MSDATTSWQKRLRVILSTRSDALNDIATWTDAEVLRGVEATLGRTLTAYMARSRSRSPVVVPDAGWPRLRAALDVYLLVARSDGDQMARQWFIGANPGLGDTSPAEALREGRLSDVTAAAHRFADDTDGY